MKSLLIYLALFAGQASTMQDRPVVRLPHSQSAITYDLGGDLIELINAPKVIQLPRTIPATDSQGNPWAIDVKNLGPAGVTILGKAPFSVQVNVGQTVHIKSNGKSYSSGR
jgi:hypothetical protein